jgi:hypothetical protein
MVPVPRPHQPRQGALAAPPASYEATAAVRQIIMKRVHLLQEELQDRLFHSNVEGDLLDLSQELLSAYGMVLFHQRARSDNVRRALSRSTIACCVRD